MRRTGVDRADVEERHSIGVIPEGLAHPRDPVPRMPPRAGLASLESLSQERDRPVDVLLVGFVHEGVVAEQRWTAHWLLCVVSVSRLDSRGLIRGSGGSAAASRSLSRASFSI